MGYFKSTIKGFSWLTSLKIVIRSITFLRTLVLARVFSPFQFGVFGIASLVWGFFEVLTETGISVFLIQGKEKLSTYINEAWLISIVRGFGIGLLTLATAPFIVSFFHSPSVYPLLLLASIIPAIRGFINPAIINFQKELNFNKEFYLRTAVYFVDSIVSVMLAFITRNIASLLFGLIASALFETASSFFFVKPTPTFQFSKEKMYKIFHKGKWVTTFNFFGFLSGETDNFIVGKILGTSPLGLYEMAYKIATIPVTEVSDLVTQVTFPVFAKIADEKKRLFRAFSKVTVFLSIVNIPLGLCMYIFPKEITVILLGNKWIAIVPILKTLALFGILRGIFGSVAAVFLAVGRQDLATGMTFARFIGLIISIVPFVLFFGLMGAPFAALFSQFVEIPLIFYGLIIVFGKKSSA